MPKEELFCDLFWMHVLSILCESYQKQHLLGNYAMIKHARIHVSI